MNRTKQELLDEFAKAALNGISANPIQFGYAVYNVNGYEEIARISYKLAKAMMVEREKELEPEDEEDAYER